MRVLLDERGVRAAIDHIADEISSAANNGVPIALIGVRSRGDILARRLAEELKSRGLPPIELGTLDITLYRDDLAEIGPSAVVRTTDIPFDVAGRCIFLIDDVIYTGRSVRAALDAIMDLGRPKAIRLVVLVDRGGRELPIQPDVVGVRTDRPQEHVRVLLRETDAADRVEVGI